MRLIKAFGHTDRINTEFDPQKRIKGQGNRRPFFVGLLLFKGNVTSNKVSIN